MLKVKKEKGKKEKKGKDEKKKKGKGAEEEDDENKFKYDESEFLNGVKSTEKYFVDNWHGKDETSNFAQKHDQDIIKCDKRLEVEAEIKKDVFEILKEELKNLKMAVDREKSKGGKGKKGKKGKSAKGKKGKKGKGSAKKGKKDKKGKGKKEKDLTANRTMESLVEELVQCGIMQRPQKAMMNDFKGNFNMNADSVATSVAIDPTLGELQRLMMEYCVLPNGLENVDKMPSVSSILLAGPRGTGKTMLVNAVASELGAYVFNLSPRVTAGNYVGKANVTKMIHMAFKVAKAHPPSIVYIDNIEMVFIKKVPKDDQSDPKRIKKDLLKTIKGLKGSDRVMVIGTSYKPWDGEAKAMLPVFDKILNCPIPDYASRYVLWEEFIRKRAPNAQYNLNVSLITRMSSGYSAGTLSLACDRALTDRRMKLIRNQPLNANEFIEQILNLPPPSTEDALALKEWYDKTPMMKKRALLLADPADEEGGDKKKGDKKGGKDKKKKK